MRRILQIASAVFILSVALSVGASASEVRDWSGPSLGVSAGYSYTYAESKGFAQNNTGGYWAAVDVPVVTEAIDQDIKSNSPLLGLDFGYNLQSGSLVYGIDLGTYYYNVNESRQDFRAYPTNATGFTIESGIDTDWLVTVAPKVGYAVGDLMFETSAGLAIANIKTSIAVIQEANGRRADERNSETALGLTAGVGMHYALDDHWSLKAKYNYVTFGKVSAAAGLYSGATYQNSDVVQRYYLSSHAMTVGLTYRF